MPAALAIIPIALTIFAGWVARRSGLVGKEAWPAIETLTFRVLIPGILIHAIAHADLNPARIGPLAVSLVGTVAVLGLAALATGLFRNRISLSGPSQSTLFQTSTRWNAFISLAAADLIAGAEGVLLVAVAMAVLVPIINVGNIFVVARLVEASASWSKTLRTVASNPLVIACAIGLLANVMLGGLPQVIGSALEIVGRAALGVGLLAVGAGIEFRRLIRVSAPVVIGLCLRPGLAPIVFLAFGVALGLSPAELIAGVLTTAVPAATNGYMVARAMGGDAELYADLVAWQTFLSLVLLPLYLTLAASL